MLVMLLRFGMLSDQITSFPQLTISLQTLVFVSGRNSILYNAISDLVQSVMIRLMFKLIS